MKTSGVTGTLLLKRLMAITHPVHSYLQGYYHTPPLQPDYQINQKSTVILRMGKVIKVI